MGKLKYKDAKYFGNKHRNSFNINIFGAIIIMDI